MGDQQVYDRPGHELSDQPPEDGLEQSFGAPDATNSDLPESHPGRKKSLTDSALSKAEETASSKKEKVPEKEEGGLYKTEGGKSRRRGRITRNQGITGGIAGLLIAGSFGTMTLVSGPLKLLHMGQLLKGFHFSSQEDAGSDRFSKIAKYIRNRNQPERSRLNRLGNAYADRIETRMNKSGIESSYSDRFGYGDGYVIDATKVKTDSELGDIVNKDWGTRDPDVIHSKVKEAISSHYNIDPGKVTFDAEGFVRIDSSDLGYFKSKKLIKGMMGDAGLDGLGGSMRARIMGKRSGITWHPMKQLDKKLLEGIDGRLSKWQEDRKQRIQNGETDIKANPPGPPDPNKPADPQAAADTATASTETTNTIQDAAASTESTSSFESFRSSTSLKLAGGIAAAVGILCTIKGLADNFDAVKYTNLVLPMMRAGMESISVGDQIKSGKDVDLKQLALYSKQLYQAEKKVSNGNKTETVPASSAFGARSIQAEQGKPLTGQDLPSEAKVGDGTNFISDFIGQFPGIDTICKAAASTAGQIGTFAIDFIGGPFSAVGGLVFGATVAPLVLDKVIHWLAGAPLDILNVAGAPYGNIINYGARFAANDSAMAAGGRPLTGTETAQLKLNRIDSQKQEMSQKSFAYRMFNPYDANTLISQVIDSQDSTIGSGMENIASGLSNLNGLLASPLKLFSSIFGNKAYAAESYDYGFPQIGFSMAEMNNKAFDNPFDNGNKVLDTLASPAGSQYIDRAEKCFGIQLDANGNSVKSIDKAPNYTDVVKNPNCSDTGEEWSRIRFYILDTQMMESQACYEGDDGSCDDIGFSGSSSGSSSPTTPTDTTAGTLPQGNAQDLAKKILDSGKVTGDSRYMAQIKAVSNGDDSCHVNPTILGLILALSEKYTLSISSLNRYCTHVLTASGPGSYHYKDRGGHAVDFNVINGIHATGSGAIDRELIKTAAGLLPPGSGFGQSDCRAGDPIVLPAGMTQFSDTCNHDHIQVPVQ